MFTHRAFISLCLIVMCCSSGLQAQDPAAPLVINISGQVYRWSPGDAAPTPTGCDLQGNELRLVLYSLIASPDGQWAAFNVVPDGTGMTAPTSTGNLWVCNLTGGEAYALSDTDPGFPYFVSEGAFSPDGSRIAWTEVVGDTANMSHARLLVHDFAARQTTVLQDTIPFDEPCGIGQGAPRVVWGEAGIAAGYLLPPQDDPCGEAREVGIIVYSESGMSRSWYPVSDMGTISDQFEWVQVGDEQHLVAWFRDWQNRSSHLIDINISKDRVDEAQGVLEAYAPSGDTPGHYLVPEPSYSGIPPQIYLPGADAPLETSTDVAFSPDGSRLVLVLGNNLYLAQQGTLEPASWNGQFKPNTEAADSSDDLFSGQLEIAWTPPTYRFVPGDIPASVCPSVEKLDLYRGGTVVAGMGANNLRSAPWPDAQIVGSIPEGDYLTAMDTLVFSAFEDSQAEVCTDGIRWREVMYQDTIGWTAEAQGDTYFLEPAR